MYTQGEIIKNQITKEKIVSICRRNIDANLVESIEPDMFGVKCNITSIYGSGSIYATPLGIESNFKFTKGGASARVLLTQIEQSKSELQKQFEKVKAMLMENAKEAKQKSVHRHNDDWER